MDGVFTIAKSKEGLMANDKISNKSSSLPSCPECDSEDISTSYENETVPYGSGTEATNLTCTVPVRKCKACGLSFTDDEAAEIRHEAVCRHLKVLTPAEVLSIRRSYGLSRNEFSKLTHIGEASLARWENGYLIQNSANDQLLFLLQFVENVERLRRREQATSPMKVSQKAGVNVSALSDAHLGSNKVFRALTPSDKEKYSVAAKTFVLRRVPAAA